MKIAALLFSNGTFKTVKVIPLPQSFGQIVQAVKGVILTIFESLIWEIVVEVFTHDDLRKVILT